MPPTVSDQTGQTDPAPTVTAGSHGDVLAFSIHGIDAETADALRAVATIVRVADESPGFPCRQCLRDADVGDELVLVSFDPFAHADDVTAQADSPYRCTSPVFLHRDDCSHRRDPERLPGQLTGRRLSVRAFDRDAMMRDAAVIDGTALGGEIERMLADPHTVRLHVHNAGAGCFAAFVVRA